MQIEEGVIPTRYGRIGYRIAGDLEDGTVPLLVLHGGPGLPSDYLEPLLALAEERLNVLLRDTARAEVLLKARSERPSFLSTALSSAGILLREGVEAALLEEWASSLPELEARSDAAQRSAEAKGWRWTGEMEEIASAFATHGLPSGFHEAAADVYRRQPLDR